MNKNKIIYKSLADTFDVSEDDINKINKLALSPLSTDDVYCFPVRLCDNDIDRVGDKMTVEFLKDVVKLAPGTTGLKDHDWSANNQLSRLYDASLVVSDTEKNKLGEPLTYVLGRAYTLSKYKDYIDSIKSGLLKETSISFNSEGDTCSICGGHMIKDGDGPAHCENGHIAGKTYDNKLCYNILNKLTDFLEWSLVAVPCQPGAGIKNKNITGGIMNKAEFLFKRFMASKAYKKADPDEQAAFDAALKETGELTEEDINNLIDENNKLKETVADLQEKLTAAEAGREQDKLVAAVDKALDDCGLIVPDVKSLLSKEIPWEDLKIAEDGSVTGLDDVLNSFRDKYKGLFKEATAEDETQKETPKEEETQKENPEDVTKKSLTSPTPGIHFGVTSKQYSNDRHTTVKSGIYFN